MGISKVEKYQEEVKFIASAYTSSFNGLAISEELKSDESMVFSKFLPGQYNQCLQPLFIIFQKIQKRYYHSALHQEKPLTSDISSLMRMNRCKGELSLFISFSLT